MAKQIAAKWRESASLIILAKNNLQPVPVPPPHSSCDYKALLFSRTATASFFPKSSVFPGGLREPADESPLWLQHFTNLGVSAEHLKQLTLVQGPRPSIYAMHGEGCLQKEISLRITAIRETFEEVGILIGRDRQSLADPASQVYGRFREDFDRAHWQRLVHNDPAQFLTLCRELQIVPDLWSLYEWSAWLTPSTFKKRFETAFYLVALENEPKLLLESNEADDHAWKSPLEYLTACLNKELWLPPPQLYELARLLNFAELAKLQDFARHRATKGTVLLLPVQYSCTDGNVALMPGDDMYPSDPHSSTAAIPIPVTMREFREGATRLHRVEFNKNKATSLLNFPLSDGHLAPLNVSKSAHL